MIINKKLSLAMAIICVTAVTFLSCKSKVSDATVRTTVEAAVANGINVDVKDGVVTLDGTVASDDEKAAAEAAVNSLDAKKSGIKSVVNNITVQAPAPVINPADSDLLSKVNDVIKDFPGIQADVKDGIITVTGELSKAKVQVLKMALDNLNPTKTDLSGITVK